jgi:hypothetical protein
MTKTLPIGAILGAALLGIWLLTAGPLSIDTTSPAGNPAFWSATSHAASPAPNNPFQDDEDERWASARTYNDGTDTPMKHVLKQHRHNSMSPGKSKFAKGFSTRSRLREIGNEVYTKGTWTYDQHLSIWKVRYEFQHVIGAKRTGEATKIVEMICNDLGRIKTFYPL